MPKVLVIGYDPDFVDFTDPGLPPGLDKEKTGAGLAKGVEMINQHGWQGTTCLVRPDNSAPAEVEQALSGNLYDCIVIGGGIRLAQNSVPVFEAILAKIRQTAPDTPVAFNHSPETSLAAAQRWIKAS